MKSIRKRDIITKFDDSFENLYDDFCELYNGMEYIRKCWKKDQDLRTNKAFCEAVFEQSDEMVVPVLGQLECFTDETKHTLTKLKELTDQLHAAFYNPVK